MCVWAAGSVAVSVPIVVPDGWFSSIEAFESAMSVGAMLAATPDEKLKFDAGWSGGSLLSTSLIAAASAVTVQLAPAGSGAVGVSVIVSVPEPPTVKGCGVEAQASVNDAAVAVTGSLKVTVIGAAGSMPVAPSAGLVRSRSAPCRRARRCRS